MIFLGLDLKPAAAFVCDPARNSLAGEIDELGVLFRGHIEPFDSRHNEAT